MHAAIYIPTGADLNRWLTACTELAQARGWHADTLVRRWDDLVSLALSGRAPVAIVGTRGHLPPDRVPRIEAVDEQPPLTVPAQRRPRRLTTPAESPPPGA